MDLQLAELNPDLTSDSFELIQGLTNKYYLTQHLRTHNQNSLKCSEINGEQLNWFQFIAERFNIPKPITLSDVLTVQRDGMSCVIQGTASTNLNCIKQIYTIAANTGSQVSDKPPQQLYNELLSNFSNTAIYLQMDGRKVILDPQALGSTICTASTTDTKSSDVFTTVMKKKFFNHMSEIASKILSGLTQTTQNLQNLYAYQLESKLPNSNKKPITDICAAAKRMIPTYASKIGRAHV